MNLTQGLELIWVYEFAGMVEWNTGVEYWTGLLECAWRYFLLQACA